jgi:hypothetical protein
MMEKCSDNRFTHVQILTSKVMKETMFELREFYTKIKAEDVVL